MSWLLLSLALLGCKAEAEFVGPPRPIETYSWWVNDPRILDEEKNPIELPLLPEPHKEQVWLTPKVFDYLFTVPARHYYVYRIKLQDQLLYELEAFRATEE